MHGIFCYKNEHLHRTHSLFTVYNQGSLRYCGDTFSSGYKGVKCDKWYVVLFHCFLYYTHNRIICL